MPSLRSQTIAKLEFGGPKQRELEKLRFQQCYKTLQWQELILGVAPGCYLCVYMGLESQLCR